MYVDIIAKNERASLEIRVTQFGVVWYIITVYGVSVWEKTEDTTWTINTNQS